ncbi:hypothetical protein FRC09_011373 [Ceratobasidium sp. 395]|nr:hypothetical protein FRC09_011373 [Ceratobasidium sp. 395]
MADLLAPNSAPLRRRTLRDGTLLLANQAANLVNVPATRNVAHDLRAFVASLRADANQPRILQAPGLNDQNAREQVANIQHHAQLIAVISEAISQIEGVNSSEPAADFVALFGQFDEYLLNTHAELQDLQQRSLTVKFACQDEITRLLEAKKEEALNRIVAFCFENGLLASYTSARAQADFKQFMELVYQHLEDERLSHDEKVQQLIAREVNAMRLTMQIDGQNYVIDRLQSLIALFFLHPPFATPSHNS